MQIVRIALFVHSAAMHTNELENRMERLHAITIDTMDKLINRLPADYC